MASSSAVLRLCRVATSRRFGLGCTGVVRHCPGGHPWSVASPSSTRCLASSTAAVEEQVITGFASDHDPQMTKATQKLARDILLDDDDEVETSGDDGKKNVKALWKRRRALAQAITLVENRSPALQEQAALLLTHLLHEEKSLERRRQSFRIGIAGAPGAGKSTFIEALGSYVLGLSSKFNAKAKEEKDPSTKKSTTPNKSGAVWNPSRLAVVCVDPSSTVSGGSILGDKTRMDQLSHHPAAYVRPAPSAGSLGGLAAYTDDVMTVCQVADYSLVILETVGLGQSEIEVLESVDMLILLVPPAGGDELQAFKKGIVEVSDLLLVTKSDGNLLPAAKTTAADYRGAMKLLNNIVGVRSSHRQTANVWHRTPVLMTSSVTGDGLDAVWKHISEFRHEKMTTGALEVERKAQRRYWMWKNFQSLVQQQTRHNPELQRTAQTLQNSLNRGAMTPRVAAAHLLDNLMGQR